MRLYLDDDSVDAILIRRLRKAGHNVSLPTDIGIVGSDDPIHLRHAIRQGRVLLSHNYKDFECLHELVREANGHHPGILIVRKDNNPNRDLKIQGIVRAIANLLAANVPVADEYTILNHWR